MEKISFLNFIDGDCVNAHDGVETDAGLRLPIRVCAPAGRAITVNGVPAAFAEGIYTAEVVLNGYRNTVVASDGVQAETIRLYRLPNVMGKYRLSSDDNIIFLADITAHADEYTSIFDNPYLAVYKAAHDRYGAKVHLNLFYEFYPVESGFPDERGYFNLSMMTDKFRDEFRANADWLKLAFHARKEMPASPYQCATAEEITEDCRRVCREIIRFAGRECISDSTTVHYGETSIEALRALRALGFRSLTGYFEKTKHNIPLVAYHTSGALTDHIGARDFWFDTDEDMLFGRIDLVLNYNTLAWVQANLPPVLDAPGRNGFVSIMIHEQYFYPDYVNYRHDFAERVLWACEYLAEHGYVGSHICAATDERHLVEGM